MSIRFIHTSDWHIGKSRTLPDYLDRQERMLDGIYQIAKDRDIDTILVAGDIYESKNIKWNEHKMFLTKLFQFDSNFTSVITNGNHDELASGVSHLWTTAMIADHGGLKHTHIVDTVPRVVHLPNMEIGVIPVVHKNTVTSRLSEMIHELYEEADQSKPFVVMLHATIAGSNTDSGWTPTEGPRIPKDCDFVSYYAVGDIHMHQQLAERAFYSGAPIQHDWGDKLPKGVLVVEIEDDREVNVELVEIPGIKTFVTLSSPPEKWPYDCYIRYTGSRDGVSLPENVIKTVDTAQDVGNETETYQFTDSLTEGLMEFLAVEGITPEQQLEAVKWVNERFAK